MSTTVAAAYPADIAIERPAESSRLWALLYVLFGIKVLALIELDAHGIPAAFGFRHPHNSAAHLQRSLSGGYGHRHARVDFHRLVDFDENTGTTDIQRPPHQNRCLLFTILFVHIRDKEQLVESRMSPSLAAVILLCHVALPLIKTRISFCATWC